MKQKQIPVLISMAAATAILLMLILWQSPSPRSESGPGPGTESGEVVRTPAESVTVRRFESPDEWNAAGAKGETYAGALAGDGFRADPTTGAVLGQSPPNGPYLPNYVIGRAYVGWDTSELPDDAEVLSATLILDLSAGGGRKEAFDIVVYRGDWIPPIDLDDWQSPVAQAVGHWRLPASRIEERETLRTGQGVTLYTLDPSQAVRVSLDPAVIETRDATRLELRHAGEGNPPNSAESCRHSSGIVPLDPSQIRLEVEYRP